VRHEVHDRVCFWRAVVSGAARDRHWGSARALLATQISGGFPYAVGTGRFGGPSPDAEPHGLDHASLDQPRHRMDFLAEAVRRAWGLLIAGDSEVFGIAALTLKVAIVATAISCAAGLPLGYFLATRRFWGRRAALTMVNTALAFPTVVVGLLLYGILSRRGP